MLTKLYPYLQDLACSLRAGLDLSDGKKERKELMSECAVIMQAGQNLPGQVPAGLQDSLEAWNSALAASQDALYSPPTDPAAQEVQDQGHQLLFDLFHRCWVLVSPPHPPPPSKRGSPYFFPCIYHMLQICNFSCATSLPRHPKAMLRVMYSACFLAGYSWRKHSFMSPAVLYFKVHASQWDACFTG